MRIYFYGLATSPQHHTIVTFVCQNEGHKTPIRLLLQPLLLLSVTQRLTLRNSSNSFIFSLVIMVPADNLPLYAGQNHTKNPNAFRIFLFKK